MNSADFLDAVRRRHKLTSDYQVGKLTGIKPSRISMYRIGKREFDDATCLAFAEALGKAPLYVIAEIQAERAKKPDIKKVWKALARMTKKAKAAALLIATPLLSGAFAFVGALSAVKAELRHMRRDLNRHETAIDNIHSRINRLLSPHKSS